MARHAKFVLSHAGPSTALRQLTAGKGICLGRRVFEEAVASGPASYNCSLSRRSSVPRISLLFQQKIIINNPGVSSQRLPYVVWDDLASIRRGLASVGALFCQDRRRVQRCEPGRSLEDQSKEMRSLNPLLLLSRSPLWWKSWRTVGPTLREVPLLKAKHEPIDNSVAE